MNSVLKQRLIGAFVLVALGVIFVPMLLERGSEDSRLSVRMEIPKKPDISSQDSLNNPPKIKPIEPLQPIEQAIAAAKQEKSESKPAVKPAIAEVKPDPPVSQSKPAAASTEKASPTTTKASDKWIVQVGSFSREENAQVLRDKLKSSGFAAYQESAKSDVGPVYRVRIGPLKNRAEAEKLVSKLLKQGGYRAMVLNGD
ncbi:MAG: SPOR domain-containing protein [Gammaproteobacteria bacterium]|nr:SPOR domain-containing protein [Gammaproteobacteria bacterium]